MTLYCMYVVMMHDNKLYLEGLFHSIRRIGSTAVVNVDAAVCAHHHARNTGSVFGAVACVCVCVCLHRPPCSRQSRTRSNCFGRNGFVFRIRHHPACCRFNPLCTAVPSSIACAYCQTSADLGGALPRVSCGLCCLSPLDTSCGSQAFLKPANETHAGLQHAAILRLQDYKSKVAKFVK